MLKNIPLMIVLAASLTACGGSGGGGGKKSSSSVALSSSAPAESSTPASSEPASSAPASSAPASSAPASSEPASSAPASSEPAASVASSEAPASSEPTVSSVAASESSSSVASSEASSSSSDASVLTFDFEEDAVGSTYGGLGWSSPAVNATVVTLASVTGLDANASSTNVLRVVALDWDSVPLFEVTLPQGKTLADYELKVDAYFPYADPDFGLTTSENWYKTFLFLAGTTISGAAQESNAAFQSKRVDTPAWNEADQWITLTFAVNPTKAALLTESFQIALGIHRPAGTNADAYYFDNVRLVELP